MKSLFHYEKCTQPGATAARFRSRLLHNVGAGVLIIAAALAIGMSGYAWFEAMSAIDAFANPAMILSGMGPLALLKTFGGKPFAGSYAIVCGLLFIAAAGLVLAPVLHRVLHRFHVDEDDK